MFDSLQYRLLKAIRPGEPPGMDGSAYAGKSKLRVLLGDALLNEMRDRVVIDFGCGDGSEAVEMAQAGARRVIGIDIREGALENARRKARQAGVEERCLFIQPPNDEQIAGLGADLVVSLDSFEHFDDPGAMLGLMRHLLRPDGRVLASFGPTWYHPLGGHLFSVFPWAHLLFSEAALIRWRNDLRSDGATRFREVEGGLNQMTIARFERIVAASPFRLDMLETVPIRKLQSLHGPLLREFTTAIVRCRLVPVQS